METLSLMTIAVIDRTAIGIPLGVWAARSPRVDRPSDRCSDAMQTIPAPVYFIPIVLLFGIRPGTGHHRNRHLLPAPGGEADHAGDPGCPRQSVEAAEMYGSTGRQTLFKVRLPMAMPFIMTGGQPDDHDGPGHRVLATLLGAGGLGQEVLEALNQRRTGPGVWPPVSPSWRWRWCWTGWGDHSLSPTGPDRLRGAT